MTQPGSVTGRERCRDPALDPLSPLRNWRRQPISVLLLGNELVFICAVSATRRRAETRGSGLYRYTMVYSCKLGATRKEVRVRLAVLQQAARPSTTCIAGGDSQARLDGTSCCLPARVVRPLRKSGNMGAKGSEVGLRKRVVQQTKR
jgi:hypothetical protein